MVHRICFITATVTETFTVTVMVTVKETMLILSEIYCYLKYFQPTSEKYHSAVSAQSISPLLNDFVSIIVTVTVTVTVSVIVRGSKSGYPI